MPLSQALSRTSASGALHQSKVVDSSQQWTPPASGPANGPSNSVQPPERQGPATGPTSERKPSIHKPARKVDDPAPETRQSLERDKEQAGPQHELSAGIVDNTTPVDRSSTASNADRSATRSISTVSEVFSHQSSRPSTNNTSRSSANPAAGNPKSSPVSGSSLATSSLTLVTERAASNAQPISATPVSQKESGAPGPSSSGMPAPGVLPSQISGLNRRISYITDVGNTKESLTKILKFRLSRLKTDARFLDSFGDSDLPQVDGLRQWELSGTAKLKWDGTLKPAILETMKNNHTTIYGNRLEVRHPRLECTMIGKTKEHANPLIRVTHNKKTVGEKLVKLLEKLELIKQVWPADTTVFQLLC